MIFADFRDVAIILSNILLALLKQMVRMDTSREMARFDAANFRWCQRRPAKPEDGCCGCGGLGDLTVTGPHPDGFQITEGYCWSCYDASPILQELTREPAVFAGHERA